jgi:hypothetical protein
MPAPSADVVAVHARYTRDRQIGEGNGHQRSWPALRNRRPAPPRPGTTVEGGPEFESHLPQPPRTSVRTPGVIGLVVPWCPSTHHRPRGLNTQGAGVPPCRWPGTARLYRGMSLAQTPPGLPLTRRSPGRGSLVGGSRRGLPCQPGSARRSAAAPGERDVPGPWLGHTRWELTRTQRSSAARHSAGRGCGRRELARLDSTDEIADRGHRMRRSGRTTAPGQEDKACPHRMTTSSP